MREDLAVDVRALFRSALKKSNGLPLLVFVDANLPPDAAWEYSEAKWKQSFDRMVTEASREVNGGEVEVGQPYNLLTVTNFAHHYGVPGKPDLPLYIYMHYPDPARCRYPIDLFHVDEVSRALKQYGGIPTEFPKGWLQS
jgi:hypothetical protein